MIRLIAALFLLLFPVSAMAAGCDGVFSANQVCGTTAGGPPKPIPFTSFPLPNPSPTTLGGVKSIAPVTNEFLTSIGTDGTPTLAGIPTPTNTTIGGVKTVTAPAHQWLNSLDTTGAFASSQPSCSDLSNGSTGCSMSTTAGGDLSGTLPSPTVAKIGGVPVTGTGASTNDVFSYNGTGWVHSALMTLLNAACTASPSSCASFFGYYSTAWYGVKCDGTTNDTTALLNALKGANNATLVFPTGGVVCLTNATVINGTNADVPKQILGNGATLRAQSSNATGYLLTIENPYANIGPSGINGANFIMKGLVIDANNLYGYPLYFHGGQASLIEDVLVLRGVHDACTFTGEPGFGLYNNTFIRVDCGDGYLGAVYASGGHCVVENSINNTGTNYNNGNTFIGLEADWCGGNGINMDYANNVHVGYDVEANVGTGIVINHSTSVTFAHGFVECNNAGNVFRTTTNCPTPPGTAFSGTASSAGVDLYGGTIVGAASGLSYSRNDLLLAPALRTFGAAASCGTGACVGSP